MFGNNYPSLLSHLLEACSSGRILHADQLTLKNIL